MNKTKKYTLVFIVVCFLFIGGAGIYNACFSSNQESPVVSEKVENDVEKEEIDSNQQEKTQQEEKEEQDSSQKEENKATQDKTESQSTTQSQTTSKQETTTSKQETTLTDQTEELSQQEEQQNEVVENVASVNVSITGVDGVIAQDHVEYEDNMSAYDALKILADNYEISVKTSGIGQKVYIKGINGLMEFDYGSRSGWKYKVNGSYPSVGAGGYVLKDGDQVEWIYTTNG
mgnify:FL=1